MKDQDEITLRIQSIREVCCGDKKMMSGPEIYGPDLQAHVKPGDRIPVEAFHPPPAT